MKDQLEQYVARVKERHQDCLGNESATKASLIAPLFAILGYHLADPRECKPEYKVDFGKYRSTKPIDWAFLINAAFAFFVEAKEAGEKLPGFAEQLADYFAKEPVVKLGILTNGIEWQFFTDLDHEHIMDKEPFLAWNVLADELIPLDFLTLLQKSNFKPQLVRTFAQRKRRRSLLVDELTKLLEPSAEFVKLAVANIETRNLSAKVVEEWTPILANAIQEWVKRRALAMALERTTDARPAEGDRLDRGIAARVGHGVTLTDVIAVGYLIAPTKLFRRYKGTMLEATLLPDGGVEFQGQRYSTASAAAEAARKAVTGQQFNTNGWTFWQYHTLDGKTLVLADARKRLERSGSKFVGDRTAGALRRHGQKGSEDQPERRRLRLKFWQGLLSRPGVKSTRHAELSPGDSGWIAAGSGLRGLPFVYAIKQEEGRVELFIDRGAGKAAENKRIFDRLEGSKQEIERTFGGKLSWERLEGKQGCRIACITTGGGYRSAESEWPEIHDAMIDAMARLEKALAPHLAKLKAELASQGA
jgi:predicted type IV restriction endonuclease